MLCVVAVREAVTPPRVRAFPKVRVDLLVVVGIAAAAVALRFWDLGAQSYWYDEAITVDLVHGSFGHMLAGVHDHEATPPLYFALAWLWAHVFGDSEAGLRSLSALFGVLTVPVAYLIGRDICSRRAGVIAAAFAAFSPALIWYSQEARSYALMVLLCALSLLFFVRALGETRPRPYALWALAVALALLTHYFSLFISIPEAVVLLLLAPNRRAAIAATGGVLAVGVAVVPLALYQRVHGGAAWIQNNPLSGRVRSAAGFFADGFAHERDVLLALVGAALVAVAVVAFRRGDARLRRAMLILLGLAVATAAIPLLGVAGRSDYILDRNLLAAGLPLAVLLAVALAAPGVGRLGLALAVAVCLAFVAADHKVAARRELQRDDWRDVSALLGPPRPRRAITVAPAWQRLSLMPYRPRLAP